MLLLSVRRAVAPWGAWAHGPDRTRWPRIRGRPVAGRANPLVRRRRATPARTRRGNRGRSPARRRRERIPPTRGHCRKSRAPTSPRRTTPRSTRCSGRWARSASRSSSPSPAARRRGRWRDAACRHCGRGRSPRRRGWLATALADLERAWGAPLPELARTVGLHDGGRAPERPSAAPSSLAADATAAEDGTSRAAMTVSTNRSRARGPAGPTTWSLRRRAAHEAATAAGMAAPRTTAMVRKGATTTP